jgi:hypothetical protein
MFKARYCQLPSTDLGGKPCFLHQHLLGIFCFVLFDFLEMKPLHICKLTSTPRSKSYKLCSVSLTWFQVTGAIHRLGSVQRRAARPGQGMVTRSRGERSLVVPGCRAGRGGAQREECVKEHHGHGMMAATHTGSSAKRTS